ncbi:MAG: hypothetical protein F6K22_13345 [Okeania sp. SIO2F4]|uniref:hypothetical protein n=1 Tax=Okeania sp. SIO2F4 TaxID=2607790 RepID=UPI001429D077|nr:hypothetical protein [Okeania sp. SIO2F4]NES03741.1 hypothetical protein [Okeania sp. SIO2F4]
MVLPFIIGGIGVAVGAAVGAFTTHAAGEKDREKAKYHRKIANELSEKYTALEKRYYELADKSNKKIKKLIRQKALDEVEKDCLRFALRLQQNLLLLMQEIDSEPSTLTLKNFREAVDFTNKVLYQLNEELIVVYVDYWNRNLIRAQEREYLEGFKKYDQGFDQSNKSGLSQEYSYSESQNKHSRNYNKKDLYYLDFQPTYREIYETGEQLLKYLQELRASRRNEGDNTHRLQGVENDIIQVINTLKNQEYLQENKTITIQNIIDNSGWHFLSDILLKMDKATQDIEKSLKIEIRGLKNQLEELHHKVKKYRKTEIIY